MKGWYVAKSKPQKETWLQSSLRPFADVDVLVKPNDLSNAHHLLVHLGYRIDYLGRRNNGPTETDLKYRKAFQYFHVDAHVTNIDPHWRLTRYPFFAPLDYDSLWGRARQASLPGTTAKVLSPEDNIVYLSLDFAMSCWYGRPELKLLRDIAQITARRDIDWEMVASISRYPGVPAATLFATSLARDLLGAPLPDNSLSRMTITGPAHWLQEKLKGALLADVTRLRYSALAALMPMLGPEDSLAKARWLSSFLFPPLELWKGLPRFLRRTL